MATFTLERTTTASMETVFDVLTDHRGYSSISAPRKAELEREGDPAPNGVGAIRVLHILGPPIREEVIVYDRPGRFAYKVLSGLPVRSQEGHVTLSHSGGGTHLSYRLDLDPKVPGFDLVMRAVIWALLRDVAKAAEQR